MSPTMYTLTLPSFTHLLRNLGHCLEKAEKYAATRGFDPTVLVTSRLAPDMFPLSRQVQIACDHAKNGVARLTGLEAPVFEDDEATVEQLKARIHKTLAWLQEVPESAFEGSAGRTITLPLRGERTLVIDGFAYVRDWALPNVYFHVTTAYDILRHNGVDLGKADFMTHAAGYIKVGGQL